tara:strand:- start:869 stop:2131 length:1263 start_codon:yes stop_codon:yes gene_type:complete
MHIAIVGSGISGLLCAHLLHPQHDVTVFEANHYPGGHANTVIVDDPTGPQAIDTGFIVFNRANYPNFSSLLKTLNVSTSPTEMSFSVQCEKSRLEYCGSSLNGLFCQRRNLVSGHHWRMILDILRFNRRALALANTCDHSMTIRDFLEKYPFGARFTNSYFLPMGAAIWSCPTTEFAEFPVRFIVDFFHNHGLLQIRNRPKWRTIDGGSARYVRELSAPFRDRIRLKTPVTSIRRDSDHVVVETANSPPEFFDEIVIACHSDQALSLLDDADSMETEVLSAFPYGKNRAVLHTDQSVLPTHHQAWASWNYFIGEDDNVRPSVTYNMNILQRLRSEQTFCVTLNDNGRIAPNHIIDELQYAHPVFSDQQHSAQSRHHELIRHRRTSYCGAYWGNGFHEAGVNSAMTVCRAFGAELDHIQHN